MVTLTGKSSFGVLWGLLTLISALLTFGVAFPVILLIVLFTRTKPRECLQDALRNAAALA